MRKQLRLNLGAGLHHSCAQAAHYGCTVVRPLTDWAQNPLKSVTHRAVLIYSPPHKKTSLFVSPVYQWMFLSMKPAGHSSWLSNLFNPEQRNPVIIYLCLHLQSLAPHSWTSGENREIGGLAGRTPRTSLSPTPCLVLPMMLHPSQGHSRGQECDPPQIPQGSNELHIVLRLGTHRSSWALLAVLPPAAPQAYRVTLILGQRRPPGST